MKPLFNAYRILATIVGVAIVLLVVVGVPLKYANVVAPDFWPNFLEKGAHGYRIGLWITQNVGVGHGMIYMVFFLVVLLIANKSRWPLGFTAVILVSGLVPFLTFWAEARVISRVRSEFPEVSS